MSTKISLCLGCYLCELPLRHWGAPCRWDRRYLSRWDWWTVVVPVYTMYFIVPRVVIYCSGLLERLCTEEQPLTWDLFWILVPVIASRVEGLSLKRLFWGCFFKTSSAELKACKVQNSPGYKHGCIPAIPIQASLFLAAGQIACYHGSKHSLYFNITSRAFTAQFMPRAVVTHFPVLPDFSLFSEVLSPFL